MCPLFPSPPHLPQNPHLHPAKHTIILMKVTGQIKKKAFNSINEVVVGHTFS